jgi:glycosyltransferase involved in cell wall biosynthesis
LYVIGYIGADLYRADAGMRIAFVLPRVSPAPVGGFKVVYEYANRLAGRGHEVTVVHPLSWQPASSLRERLHLRFWVWRLGRDRTAIAPWAEIDRRVELALVADPSRIEFAAFDAIVATAWQTAGLVAAAAPAGGGFYLIQGYETWAADPEEVRRTWSLPLRKIVISRWLAEIAAELGQGEGTSYVPIGMDQKRWGVDEPPEVRQPHVGVAFSSFKDSGEAIAALAGAREQVPDLLATGFGTGEPPAELPPWVEYVRRPDPAQLRALYNSCSIFLQANGMEGWGLPAAEAMACGCALVSYDTGGSREYASDGETARVVDRRDAGTLAAAIAELAADRELRLALSRRGRERVGKFTWERAVDGLERVLKATVASREAGP